jgi:hypothetical protein
MRRLDAATLLGAGRIIVFGVWFAYLLPLDLALVSELPRTLFTPRGVLLLLPDTVIEWLLAPGVAGAVKLFALAGCAAVVIGLRPHRTIAVPVTIVVLVIDALLKGFNELIGHAQIGMSVAAVILCLFPAADRLSLLRSKASAVPQLYAAGVLSVGLFLASTYSFIGVHRVMSGGLQIFTGDALLTYLANRSLHYATFRFEAGLLPLFHPLLAVLMKLGYAVTTLFEILAPLIVVNSWFRRVWIAVIVPFHVMTLVTMNIFFWENLLLIAGFVAPLGIVLDDAMRPATAPLSGSARRSAAASVTR